MRGEVVTAHPLYDNLDGKGRRELLSKVGETREEARVLGQRDYDALGGWLKARLKRYWKHSSAKPE